MTATQVLKRILPVSVRRWLRQQQRHLDQIDFGSLRRIEPVSREFGFDRGRPIDRFYIERFLAAHQTDIRGHVLELGDDTYTRRFGGNRVARSDVLHATPDNPKATIVADLTRADAIANDRFDCILFTQSLPFIYDTRAALATLRRILKPGGVVLATFPGISQISRHDMDRWGDYWRFTSLSARRLFGDAFGTENIAIQTYGNVLAAVALLHGLAAQELTDDELNHRDPDYEVVIAARACKK
jgi:SAM-dependent methyltransferase